MPTGVREPVSMRSSAATVSSRTAAAEPIIYDVQHAVYHMLYVIHVYKYKLFVLYFVGSATMKHRQCHIEM